MVSLAEVVREKVESQPFTRYSLAVGIVNYSALAKKMKKEVVSTLGRDVSEDAMVAALRRYSEKLGADVRNREEAIAKLFAKSNVRLISGRVDLTLKADWAALEKTRSIPGLEDFHIIRGTKAVTIICNRAQLSALRKVFGSLVTRVRDNLVELCVESGEQIEATPGSVAYLTSLLAENNINIVEVVSCYTDTILVLSKKDGTRAFEIIESKIREFSSQ